MKRQAAGAWARTIIVAATLAAVGGCASGPKAATGPIVASTTGSVVDGTFVRQSSAQLTPPTPITNLLAVGDGIYAYTDDNTVYSLSSGLDIRFIRQIVPAQELLRPLVEVADELVFPTSKGMFVYSKDGTQLRTISLQHPLSSDVHVDQRGLLLAGTASPTGGRVVVIDPKRERRATDQETLIGNVMSAPVSLQGIVFAATDKGRVFAIGDENRAAWAVDGLSFQTNRPIEADLVIDDFALYVAGTDFTLYALDRSTGRIKWRYAAEVALREAPLVTKDRVYQVVPGLGLASIDKLEGKLYREPLWMAPGVTKVLAADERFVYAVQGEDRLVALGVADGKEKFAATGRFEFVTASAAGIFAATADGRVVKLARGPYTGEPAATASR